MATATPARPFSCEFVSIVIRICDQRYNVDRIDAGEDGPIAYRLTKHGAKPATYNAILTHAGLIECDCPDYEFRHRGRDADGCKHALALRQLGLMPAPSAPCGAPGCVDGPATCALPGCVVRRAPVAHVPDEFDAPGSCCTAEPLPCLGCTPDAVRARGDALARSGDYPDEPPTLDDAGPGPEDLADFGEWALESAAREFLNPADATLTLPELVEHNARFFRSWPSSAGEMIADALDELTLKVRLTDAATPADYAARKDALDADARETWEAIGYDSARRECGCEEPGTAFGHMA